MSKKADPRNWVERKVNGKFAGNTDTRYALISEPLARKSFETTGLEETRSTGP